MADTSGLNPSLFALEQGLVLDVANFLVPPGAAKVLENFEPAISGGYRRINGYNKWIQQPLPQTGGATDPVLMSAIYGNEVIAARNEEVYRGANGSTTLDVGITASDTSMTVPSTAGFSETGTLLVNSEIITYTGITSTTFTGLTRGTGGSTAAAHSASDTVLQDWTLIDSGRTGAEKMVFDKVHFAGTDYLVFCDGVNAPSHWNGSTVTDISDASIPDPSLVVSFKNSMFFAGMSASPNEVVFTAPLTLDDFASGNGAGSFAIDSPVTSMIVFREELYIFAARRIYKLTGNTSADFVLQPVTREIGCENHFTVQEFAGDVVFLGADGIRTVAGTDKIGDVELGSISRNIQSVFTAQTDRDEFDSYVIPSKTQYRLSFTKANTNNGDTTGVIMVRKGDNFEFSTTKGLKMSCSDYDTILTTETIVHGDWDGYVYKDEEGPSWDGSAVIGKYRTPDITFGDPGIRKAFQRLIINYTPEASISTRLRLLYDYEANVPQPLPYTLSTATVIAQYGVAEYGGGTTYGGQAEPLLRQPVEGSGFAIAIKIEDTEETQPYVLKGFQFEFTAGARR